jgi:carbamoyltransferase
MNILGINNFFEHPSISIICDGKLVFSIEEERLTKIKGGKRYSPYSVYIPFRSIYAGLKYMNMTIKDIDVIAFSYKKWKHFKESFTCLAGKRYSTFGDEMCAMEGLMHLKKALHSQYETFQYMMDCIPTEDLKKVPIVYYDHHSSHGASAFFCSGFQKSLVLVADGCGEGSSTTLYLGQGNHMDRIKEFKLPHSLGFFYSMVTHHLGFNTFQDEYKVMGLASYGKNKFLEEFKKVITYDENGFYKINKKMLNNLDEVFGPARKPSDPIEERYKDIAKSLQFITEDILIKFLKYNQKKYNVKNLCMAGGVALNCVANGKISNAGIFEHIFVQPISGDAGTSVGAAALYNAEKNPTSPQLKYDDFYLGTSYNNDKILDCIKQAGITYEYMEDENIISEAAKLMAEGKVGGIFRGRMEAGPRALGNRSVIASPIPDDMLKRINKIKGREMFRPIAPIVLEEKFDEYFEGEKNRYMLFTCNVKPEKKAKIPAVTHVDYSSRVQTVTKESNEFVYELIKEFDRLTRVPVIINTSLNFKGQPIVENPLDAIGNFYTSGLEFIIIGNYLLRK